MINTIVGGFMRGSSNSARKWHVRNLKMIDSVEGEKKPTRSMPYWLENALKSFDRNEDATILWQQANTFITVVEGIPLFSTTTKPYSTRYGRLHGSHKPSGTVKNHSFKNIV